MNRLVKLQHAFLCHLLFTGLLRSGGQCVSSAYETVDNFIISAQILRCS